MNLIYKLYNMNFILSLLQNIKWTPLKISIVLNIVLLIFVIFLFKSPKPIKPEVIIETHTITIPGKDGRIDTIYQPKPYKVVNPINSELLKQYTALKDSVKKLEMYSDAIAEREYNEFYEDSNVKIDIYTKIQGKLLKQAPKYFIKPITVSFTDTTTINYNKPPTNKLLGGIELGLPQFGNPSIKGSIYLQNKKDNIISLGYDTNKTIWIGYIIKL